MRAFGYVTAIVLVVIGIAVGALAATNGAALDNVSGRFVAVGGRYPPHPPVPVTGMVIFTGTTGITYTAAAGETGNWAIAVPPGTYAVVGVGRAGERCGGGSVKVLGGRAVGGVTIACVMF